MATTLISKRLISRDEYHKMGQLGLLKPDENVELIHGEILNMTPIGSRHLSIVNKLNMLFMRAISDNCIISIQNPLHIDQWNEPEPDVVVLNYREDEYAGSTPQPSDVRAVIEVAESTYGFDKKVKLSLYATAAIPGYWIVDLRKKRVEEFSQPSGSLYQDHSIFYPGDQIILEERTFGVSEMLSSIL